ncbi:MAG TPA: hypothetical protein VL424_04900 [Pararobbsia sp.]|nr:hypothetical protein [Pararobbsia sp.]
MTGPLIESAVARFGNVANIGSDDHRLHCHFGAPVMSSSCPAVYLPPDLAATRVVVHEPGDAPVQASFWSRVSRVFNAPNVLRALKVVPLGTLAIATGAGTLTGAVFAGIQLAQSGVGGVLVAGPTCALLGSVGGGISGGLAVATVAAARGNCDDEKPGTLLKTIAIKSICIGAGACAAGGFVSSILACALA